MKKRYLALFAAICLPALAHDLWLVPPALSVAAGPVTIDVAVGMDFPKSLSALDPERIEFTVHGPSGATSEVNAIPGMDDTPLRARFTAFTAGAWLVGGTTLPNRIELEAAKFNDYLLHDGLPHVLAGRMDRGETGLDAVELYSKFVKCLMAVDAPGSDTAMKVLGHTLEIVPLRDPLTAAPGSTLPVRVLFRGEPLERANLCWDHPGNGEDFTGQTWTDAEGRALVPIVRSGPTTLRLVHMTRPRADEHEWESFWSSFTFHSPEGDAYAVPGPGR